MALSGSFGNTFRTGYRIQVDWSATQNIEGNYSTVTANFYLISLGSSYTISSSATKYGSQTINGSSNSFSTAGAGLSGNQKKLLNTYTVNVSHNADGTKTFDMSAWYDINVTLGGTYYGRVSCSSGTITLDTIPRASSLTSSCNWTAGTQDLAVSISRASGSFTHTVEVRVQKPDGTWVYIGARGGIGTSTTFDFSLNENTSIYTAISQYENRPSWVRLITYNGGTQIGYKDYYGTVYGAGIAKISFSNFNIGDSIPATITGMQNYEGFQYTGIFKVNGTTIKTFTFSPSTPNPTLTFTTTEINNMYAQTPNSNSVSGQVEVTSKYNGVDINDKLPAPTYDPMFNFTCYVTNANPTFSASSISYKDTNTTTTTVTGNDQYIIQNKSSLTAYVNTTATAQKSATLVKYVVTVGGKQGEITTATGNVNIGTIDASSNQTLTITAIDSRGNQTSVTKAVNMVAYSNPTLAVSLERANKFDRSTTLKVSGSFSLLTVSTANKNSISSLKYRYKEKGASTFGSDVTLVFTTSNGTITANNVTLDLDNTKAYDFEVVIVDKLTTVTTPASVGTGQPILFIDSTKKSVGVMRFPTSRELEVEGYIRSKGVFGMYLDDEMLKDYMNGNVTLSALGGDLYLGYKNTTKVRMFSDLYTSNGSLQIIDGATGKLTANGGGQAFDLKAGTSSDHVYMAFYADTQAQTTRSGYIGYPSAGSTTLTLKNEMTNGGIELAGSGTGRVKIVGDGEVTGNLNLSTTSKIMFPADPYGGTGDRVSIYLQNWSGGTTEDMELVIDAQNDAQDRVRITSRLYVDDAIYTPWSVNAGTIELQATYPYIDFKTSDVDLDTRIIQRDGNIHIESGNVKILDGATFVSTIIVGQGAQHGVGGAIWYGNGYAGNGFYAHVGTGWVKW
jgi:hypothetical protein